MKRNEKYLQTISKKINSNSVCLCLTDASLLGLSIAKMNVKKVYLLETNSLSRRTIETFIKKNDLTNKVRIVGSVDELPSDKDVSLIFGEPYYVSSILPWDNLHFWYLASRYSCNIPRVPTKAVVKCIVVDFKDLHKIRAPLGICEGFDLTIFDDLVQVQKKILISKCCVIVD